MSTFTRLYFANRTNRTEEHAKPAENPDEHLGSLELVPGDAGISTAPGMPEDAQAHHRRGSPASTDATDGPSVARPERKAGGLRPVDDFKAAIRRLISRG
jgi:hypothetical protein